jgi:cytidylate kinase
VEWRALRISEKQECSIEKARTYVKNMDKKRAQFRDLFQGKGTDYTRFDIKINCMTLGVSEIVDIIVGALRTRAML